MQDIKENPTTTLLTESHGFESRQAKQPRVVPKREVVRGSGTVLVAPSTMGRGSMTGAGAIVKAGTEIGDDQVFVGVPARFLRNKSDGGSPAQEG